MSYFSVSIRSKTGEDYTLRNLLKHDLDQIVNLDKLAFTQAWTKDEILFRIKQQNQKFYVIEDGAELVGFLCYEQGVVDKNTYPFVIPEGYPYSRTIALHIISVVTAPKCRYKGLAKNAVKSVLDMNKNVCCIAVTEVDERNVDGQLFLKACGFKYYLTHQGGESDTYLMRKLI